MEHYIVKLISDLVPNARWLDESKAKNAYEHALRYDSNDHYGLNTKTVSSIHKVSTQSPSITQAWLDKFWPITNTVQIIFDDRMVCVAPSESINQHWSGLFFGMDAIVLHNTDVDILFFYHEGEIEHGRRII